MFWQAWQVKVNLKRQGICSKTQLDYIQRLFTKNYTPLLEHAIDLFAGQMRVKKVKADAAEYTLGQNLI